MVDIMFYLLSAVLLMGALGVITSRNPMYCVMLLILCFFNAAGLFILVGAEFLGLLLVMVYVGAIAVLFLFVLMTTDINFAVLKEGYTRYLPAGIAVGAVFVAQLVVAAYAGVFSGARLSIFGAFPAPVDGNNITSIGRVLFTDFVLPFQTAGLLLLVAMVGAIVLTHRRRQGVKRQIVGEQVIRRRDECIEKVNVKSGQGL